MKSKEKAVGTTGKRIVYEEKAPFSRTIRLFMKLVVLIVALLTVVAVFGNFFGLEKEPFTFKEQILNLAGTFVILAVYGLFNMKFRITEDSVEAVMPPFFSYRVLFSEIKDVSTTDIPWYSSMGLRIRGRRLAFVSIHKKAVKIEKENGFFRTLILTPRDPDEFVRIVKERMR